MPTTEERMTILRMVEEGKISAEDAARLLAALGQADGVAPPAPEPPPASVSRTVRIRVTDQVTGRQKASIVIPASLVNLVLRFVPPRSGVDVGAVRAAIEGGLSGKIVDVIEDKEGNHVEIFLD
jgi:hypothetical protein